MIAAKRGAEIKIARILLLVVVIAGLAIWYFTAQAQDKDDQHATGKNTTVTGCLAKGDSPNEFYLTGDDGKRYEVRSDTVKLGDHLGHKVTLVGTAAKESDKDKHKDEDEDEAREATAANLQVSSVQMVSSCK
ncbi:MAG TPA: hypothetical protein VN622_03600 [Clostridia bacterium]|nr:hypothetical protein [Clostridia bacterium]